MLKQVRIQITHRTACTLRSVVTHPKDFLSVGQKSNAVYKFQCVGYPGRYAHETPKLKGMRGKNIGRQLDVGILDSDLRTDDWHQSFVPVLGRVGHFSQHS